MKSIRIILILLAFFIHLASYGQDKMDSILVVLSNAQGKEKVDILNDLSSQLLSIKPNQSFEYINQSLTYTRSIQYEKGASRALSILARYYSKHKQFIKSDSLLRLSENIGQEISDEEELVYVAFVKGLNLLRQNKYAEAIESQLNVLDYAKNTKDFDFQVSCLNNIGFALQKIKRLEEAKTYFLQSLQIAEDHNLTLRIGEIHLNLGVLEYLKNNVGLSIEHNQKAYETLQEINVAAASKALNNLGFAHNLLGNTSKAMRYYDKSLVLRKKIGDLRGYGKVLNNQAKLIYPNEPKKSIALIEESIAIANDIHSYELLREGHYFLYEHFEKVKNHDKALQSFKRYVQSNDSIKKRSNAQKVSDILSKNRLVELEKTNDIINLELKNKNLYIIIIILSLLILTITFIIYWQKSKRTLKVSRVKADHIENEKKILAQELDNTRLELKSKIEKINQNALGQNIESILDSIKNALLKDRDWITFLIYFDQLYPHFFNNLKDKKQIDLTINEQRLIALMKIKLTTKEISTILHISPNSVLRAKTRLKDKLNFESIDSMLLAVQKL